MTPNPHGLSPTTRRRTHGALLATALGAVSLITAAGISDAAVDPLELSAWTQLGADIDGATEGVESGNAVSLSADGTTVAIGAAYDNDGTGYVSVLRWNGSSWTQLGTDIDGEAAGDRSGYSVSLSADGTTIAIGARNNGNGAGHVRIHQWNGSAWTQLGTDIDGEAVEDKSGYSVSLSADGTTVAIGAIGNDGNGNGAGHVRIHHWDGSAWTQLGTDIDGEAAGDYSGSSVSLSADGTTVAIGAPSNDGNGNYAGHARIHHWDGSAWTQLGTDIDGGAAGDYSAEAVSLSADGTTVAIGAPEDDGNADNAGHVRIHHWDGSAWTQLVDDIDGEAADDYSGSAVALSADGTTVAIGARNNGNYAGHVRIFQNPTPPPTTTTTTTAPTTTTVPTTTTTVPTTTTTTAPPTTAAPTNTVPTPDGAITDAAAITPGQTVSVSAPCKTGRKVSIKLGSQSRIADCVATTAAIGQPITYDGLATTTLTAPLTPGRYQIEVELEGTGIRYVIPLTVIGGELPATGSTNQLPGIALLLIAAGTALTATTRRRRHI